MSEMLNDVEPDSGPHPGPPASPDRTDIWRRRLRIVSHFLTGQVIVQGLNFLTGFLLLRWMDVNTFAQYSVAWAFQTSVGALVDLGLTGSIVALVGEQAHDPAAVGRAVRTARYFRIRSYLVVVLVSCILFPIAVRNQPWGWQVKSLLFVGIMAGLAGQNVVMYASVLLMARELKPYYRAQITSGIVRQAGCFLLYVTGTLTSWAASWVSAIAIATYGLLYRRSARPLIIEPEKADPETNRQLMRIIMPLVPSILFGAVQSQLTVALIAFFGKTRNIAEVSALGRLSALFLLLTTFNGVVIEPHIARIARANLRQRYLQILSVQFAIGIAITSTAYFAPGLFLWILGPKYANLRAQVVWVTATSSIEYLAASMWVMHAARKWIYWWATWSYIGVIIVVQLSCAGFLHLDTTQGVIVFDFLTNAGIICLHIATAFYGFRFGPPKAMRKAQPTASPVA